MDSLTHGLLGLAVGCLRRVDTQRSAVLVGCVLAAELPDLDYLWPASDPVLHALKAHRGLSHALVSVPLVALVAAGIVKVAFRRANAWTVFAWSAFSTLVAHLLADAWTGWGTRLLLPLSNERVTLDWMMVVDPLFTAPLLIAALWSARSRTLSRKAMLIGLSVASSYLVLRVGIKTLLDHRVRAAYPSAVEVQVFPSWFGPTHWRYVASSPGRYAVGRVDVFSEPEQQAVHERPSKDALSAASLSNGTVREALAWARFPIVSERDLTDGIQVRIADLRYHLNGQPTLSFHIDLDGSGRVTRAELDRGGSARALFERFNRQ